MSSTREVHSIPWCSSGPGLNPSQGRCVWASLVAQRVKSLPATWETRVQSLGQEDSLEKGMATPLQYSCLENSMDRGAWWATVHRVAKSWTRREIKGGA